MKRISRILSLVIVVGIIAAIPASTQILFGSGGESSDESNLPMLILVNRLEMSEEQMEELHGILTNLLDEREQIDALQSAFEDAMIEFDGTGEELDEMLATFREDQRALAVAVRESLATSLDAARDMLSINQGIVLQRELPALLRADAAQRIAPSNDRLPNTSPMTGSRMPSSSIRQIGVLEQQLPRGEQVQSPMPGGTRMGDRREAFDQAPDRFGDDSMTSMMQERFGNDTMPEMSDERMEQRMSDADIGTMLEQMRDRVEQFGGQVPEELREQFADRFGAAIEARGSRPSLPTAGNLGQMDLRGHTMPEHSSVVGRIGEQDVDLFELLGQVADVLELKLGAME